MARRKKTKSIFLRRDYLIQHRIERDLSQLDVAETVGIEHCTYNQIENGKLGGLMNARKLVGLATAFGVSVDAICHEEIAYLDKVDTVNHIERR